MGVAGLDCLKGLESLESLDGTYITVLKVRLCRPTYIVHQTSYVVHLGAGLGGLESLDGHILRF